MSTAQTKIPNAAKRGDLVAIEHESVDYVNGKGNQLRIAVTLHRVTSVRRDGSVNLTTDVGWGNSHKVDLLRERVFVIAADKVDADALTAAYRAHTYPGHPTQVMPFASVDAFREFTIPYRK